MHELLPETVHLKMKMSMFVQAWLPYLTDDDAAKLLGMLGFSNEYVEMERPKGRTIDCSGCKTKLFAPEGSYRVFCEKCRKSTNVNSVFYCTSCGSPNSVPENPGKPIDCERCGIANRLVRPLLGTGLWFPLLAAIFQVTAKARTQNETTSCLTKLLHN